MNRLIILICMILIPLHINAISINEIRNNPSQFKLVYSDETREAYVDNSAISVTRYNPPYYAINATIYSVWYDRNIIVETNQTSFYNYERSIEKLSHKYKDVDEIVKEVSNDTGVRWKANTFVFYDFNGNMLSSKPLSHQFDNSISGKAILFSPSYQVAMYIFYKSYHMYFNYPR